MSKKHFIALADAMRTVEARIAEAEPTSVIRNDPWAIMQLIRHVIANVCAAENSRFNRQRWMEYIAGECGPNGGKVKP